MATARVNGIDIHHRTSGQGPDVVLIHGLAANLAFWYLNVVPHLGGEYRTTVYDLRGHGKSGMPASGYTSADMAEDLHALLDSLGIAQAHLVGHSFGGEVALQCAATRPERVLSLTLADARVRAFQPVQRLSDWPDGEQTLRRLRAFGMTLDDDEMEAGHRLLEEFAAARLRIKDGPIRAALEVFVPFGSGSGGQRAAAQWLRLYRGTTARDDFRSVASLTREAIGRLRQPLLAVYGERSRCLPSLRGLQETLPQCRTVVIPGAAHYHPVTHPALFARTFREFLLSVGAEAGALR